MVARGRGLKFRGILCLLALKPAGSVSSSSAVSIRNYFGVFCIILGIIVYARGKSGQEYSVVSAWDQIRLFDVIDHIFDILLLF